jgi:hypothetical protein
MEFPSGRLVTFQSAPTVLGISTDGKPSKCANPACGCPISQGEKHCSVYCENSGEPAELPCGCGHRGCIQEKLPKAARGIPSDNALIGVESRNEADQGAERFYLFDT